MRGESKLLVADRATGTVSHRRFSDLAELIPAGDALVVNTTSAGQAIRDSFSLRRSALTRDVPYFTTIAAARAAALAIAALRRGALDVRSLQEYHS